MPYGSRRLIFFFFFFFFLFFWSISLRVLRDLRGSIEGRRGPREARIALPA